MKNFSQTSLFSFLSLVILACSSAAFSQQIPSQVEPQQIQNTFKEVEIEQSNLPDEKLLSPELLKSKDGDAKIFKLNGINLHGNELYSDNILKAYAEPFIGKKVSFNDLLAITGSITKKYRDNGYILSKATLSTQKIKDGVVGILVTEGYISEVNLVGRDEDAELLREYAEKLSSKRPVNKKDIERYMLLADDLPGTKARSLIKPSRTTPGASELVINLEHDKFEGAVTVDNYGSRFIGPIQATGVFAVNSFFADHDRTTIRTILTPDEELYFGDILHEQQLDSEGTKLRSRLAYSNTKPGSRLDGLDILGKSFIFDNYIMVNHLRGRRENFNSLYGIKYIDSESDIIGVNISEDRVRTLYAGMTYDFEDFLEASNTISVRLSRGVKTFNSTSDGVGRSRANGKHNFTKISTDISRVQRVYGNISAFVGAQGQVADGPLLASEEVAYGGRRYGRAYDPAEITGDNGLASMIELRYGKLLSGDMLLESLQFYGFYDIAAVWNKSTVVGEPKKQTLASTGLGVRFNVVEDVTGDLSVAFPMTREVNANGTKHGDDPRVFFSLTKRF